MRFLTRTAISRRHVLRGAGTVLALPFLNAMVPAATAFGATNKIPKRFGAIFVPHGERPSHWAPKEVGTNVELNTIMKPLEAYRDQITVVSNLANPVAGHAVSVASWLSGTVPKRTVAEDVRAGISIDQAIANKIHGGTVFKSLEVATEDVTGYIGGCDPGYACVYLNTLSWASETEPLPMEINPRRLFERMFGRPGTPEQRIARLATGRSILDSVQDDLHDLTREIGPQDRARLDSYLENVRETEKRIERAERQANVDLDVPAAPVGIPDSFPEHIAVQFELIALAYAADLTRVFTFMLSRDITQRTYPEIGITEPHHSLSHHGGNVDKQAQLVKLNLYHMGMFEKFLARLNEIPDGDGSVLDNTMILWGSGMSESNNHDPKDLPTLLVGGFGKRGSRHVKAAPDTPVANMMLTLAQHFGIETDTYGISTGTVDV